MEQPEHGELQQVVAALTEGVILVATDQRIVFANEAALTMHGVAHLSELGRTVDEYRSRFLLRYRNNHMVKPEEYPIERVLAGEAFDQVIVEVERRDDPSCCWTHRIRSLVVAGADGLPDLLVLIVSDVSEQFKAEERFARAFGANPAPALICRLADQRFLKMNDGFADLTGFERDDVVGRTLAEVDVLSDASRRDLALERLQAGETIPQMEASLPTAAGGGRLVIVAGQPIELDDEACMLFTFADLEPRRLAEGELKESQARSEKMFRLAPVPMTLAGREDGRLREVNQAFSAATGFKPEESLDRTLPELGLWPDAATLDRFHGELDRQGGVRGFEALLREKDGSAMDALVSAETVMIGGQPYVLSAFQDISSRKRSEAELMRAIEAVMSDASWFSQAVVERLAALRAPRREDSNAAASIGQLTAREREVLELMCRGLDDGEIGAQLGVSRNTVHNHVSSLFRKIGVNRRSAAVVWARDRGFGDGAPAKRQRRPRR